jgi:hypothetical protein
LGGEQLGVGVAGGQVEVGIRFGINKTEWGHSLFLCRFLFLWLAGLLAALVALGAFFR